MIQSITALPLKVIFFTFLMINACSVQGETSILDGDEIIKNETLKQKLYDRYSTVLEIAKNNANKTRCVHLQDAKGILLFDLAWINRDLDSIQVIRPNDFDKTENGINPDQGCSQDHLGAQCLSMNEHKNFMPIQCTCIRTQNNRGRSIEYKWRECELPIFAD